MEKFFDVMGLTAIYFGTPLLFVMLWVTWYHRRQENYRLEKRERKKEKKRLKKLKLAEQ